MSDIIISGYYGFTNAGDELILEAIIADLRFYNPDVKITVLSAKPWETCIKHNVHSVNRWNIFSVVGEIANCEMLLSGSGGLFQDTTGTLSLWYYLLIILTAKIFGKTVFVYAAGIGEIKYAFNRFLIKNCFNNVDFITVRTEQDNKLLKSFGVNTEITVTADPVFSLKLSSSEKRRTEKQCVGIILRKTKNFRKDIKIFSELSDLIVKNLKSEVILIPFQLSKDIKLLNIIKNNMKSEGTIFLWNDTEKLLELLSQLDIIVSMRLHGLILAAKYKIPFVAVPRYSKIKNFLQMIGESVIEDTDELKTEEIYTQISDKTIGKKNPEKISVIIQDLQNRSKKTAELCISVLTHNKNMI